MAPLGVLAQTSWVPPKDPQVMELSALELYRWALSEVPIEEARRKFQALRANGPVVVRVKYDLFEKGWQDR